MLRISDLFWVKQFRSERIALFSSSCWYSNILCVTVIGNLEFAEIVFFDSRKTRPLPPLPYILLILLLIVFIVLMFRSTVVYSRCILSAVLINEDCIVLYCVAFGYPTSGRFLGQKVKDQGFKVTGSQSAKTLKAIEWPAWDFAPLSSGHPPARYSCFA